MTTDIKTGNISPITTLLKRTGFGYQGVPQQFGQSTYSQIVDSLLSSGPSSLVSPPPQMTSLVDLLQSSPASRNQALKAINRDEQPALVGWWMDQMAATPQPLSEKLTLFYHGHFSTAISKVRVPYVMFAQNQLLRSSFAAPFSTLTKAVSKDPAMMIWLDTRLDRAAHPNENFARELMEIFTIGVGNYTETDVREGARAFTGYTISKATGSYAFNAAQHDFGTKTFLGQVGDFNGDDVIDIILSKPASARFITASLWSHFAYPISPSDPIATELTASYSPNQPITTTLRAIINHPLFVSSPATQGLIKQPIEYVVALMRSFNLKSSDIGLAKLNYALRSLGQVPFDPPNVGGWPQNGYWLSTATAVARLVAGSVLDRTSAGEQLKATPAPQRVQTILAQLGIQSPSTQTASALKQVSSNPRALLMFALSCPEFVSV